MGRNKKKGKRRDDESSGSSSSDDAVDGARKSPKKEDAAKSPKKDDIGKSPKKEDAGKSPKKADKKKDKQKKFESARALSFGETVPSAGDAPLSPHYANGSDKFPLSSAAGAPSDVRVTAIFSVKDKVGALDDALRLFKKYNLSLTRIESRPSHSRPEFDFDFYVDFMGPMPEGFADELRADVGPLKVFHNADTSVTTWFPRKIGDLDLYANKVLSAGADLDADHPGFHDPVYRARRKEITTLALGYRHGQQIAHVEYTPEEIATWRTVYEKLIGLYPSHACRQHRQALSLLQRNCNYGPDNIPQLDTVSNFLHDCTGFTLRPVAGLLSSRDFLNGLAFRVFHSTQYIRHHSRPLYTPEPDVCHELLGHVPLFADPDFAEFSQEIGLASLGASDAFIEQLATCYWFTVEFGLCREEGEVRAYGAGLLSSFGELEYCLTDKPKLLEFDPFVAGKTKYPITTYQPTYFVTPSFQDSGRLMRSFAATSGREFQVSFNPYTATVEVLDTREKLIRLAGRIGTQVQTLQRALLFL